ncbi:hypothetical protein [Psychrobium sp. 1_MG-2023]|uniref:hypothetical protein n=1 Tax=Psychrobium sp. 1_MG-2023 TaxID=3062624 RepID=UPI000C324880|nr:hypothetical protein [Psychrobium sp. 1_MG-2023]MDP2562565.1 hypothetical protein [Psychrobium sp. 1_MG-2023]PKF56783.1 hypothetical protein CW748_08580 [Alteromonadales bacterium alter-6D02]
MKYHFVACLALFASFTASANQPEFISSELTTISFDLDKYQYYLEDALANTESCKQAGLVNCIVVGQSIIAITDNVLGAPEQNVSEVTLTDGTEIYSIPILHTVKIMGTAYQGYIVRVESSQPEKNSTIFYSTTAGVIMFSLNGLSYWSKKPCGLFAPETCGQ